MKLTDTFYCDYLAGSLSYRTCIARQQAKNKFGLVEIKNLECTNCLEGKQIAQEFKDEKIEKIINYVKPPHEFLIGQVSRQYEKRSKNFLKAVYQTYPKSVTPPLSGEVAPIASPELFLSKEEEDLADMLDKIGETKKILEGLK